MVAIERHEVGAIDIDPHQGKHPVRPVTTTELLPAREYDPARRQDGWSEVATEIEGQTMERLALMIRAIQCQCRTARSLVGPS